MKTYKLIPQFRDNCVIQGKKDWLSEYQRGDTIFLISSQPSKKFSIISKIEALEFNDDPKIFIDKRNLEEFGENDEVYVLKYNPAEALEIKINVSNEYGIITKGDWTSNIKPSLVNKLIDMGQEVSFLIPWDGGAPIIGSGIINYTLPSPPVFIGERTRIFLEKSSNEELSKIKSDNITRKKDRVDILEKQIKQNTIEFIKKIKHENYPNKGQKYQFKATNPRQLFNSILTIFKGLEPIEDPNEQFFDVKEQDYLATAVFLNKQDHDGFKIIDIQIMSSENSGTLIVWVTGESESIIMEMLRRYDSKISELKQGLEQRTEVISAQCPECGGDLPIKNIDMNGIIECVFCNKTSKIPKALRY